MSYQIRKAAVIGSGVMGAAIAAHLANAGIPSLLLDIVPNKLNEEEEKKNYTLNSLQVRNRLANHAIQRMLKTNPSPFFNQANASLITPGNIEDDLDELSGVDWIIEAVVERLDVKQSLLHRIESVYKAGTIVSTNTSGISVNAMTEGLSNEFCRHFLGTHFFNPPRYMKLLEIIPGVQTKPEIVSFMSRFCEKQLGKGVVLCKDTPNFIANRIGAYGMLLTLDVTLKGGYTIEEVDAVTGSAMGRPNSASYRLLDLIGIDTILHASGNVDDGFEAPKALQTMVERGWIGDKAGQGFYRKIKTSEGKVIEALRLDTFQYEQLTKPKGASLEKVKAAKGAANKLNAILATNDRYSDLAWKLIKPVLLFSAQKLGEIADSITDIDNAMKWGFNWELGPFELWDAIGLKASVKRMEAEGEQVPDWVKQWIAAGNATFYQTNEQGEIYSYFNNDVIRVEQSPEIITLQTLKKAGKRVLGNAGASLIDIGDDVVCLEFHSQNNAIGSDILSMILQSLEEVRNNWKGLVIANQGKNFCVGANLMLILAEAQSGEWDEIDLMIRRFHQAVTALKTFEKPIVAAPHRMTLGGGVEICLPADRIAFSAETYFGLVEVGVGVIPAGGGLKETVLRIHNQTKDIPNSDLQPFVNHAFETIAMAKVSTSGADVRRLGYMRPVDRIIMNGDHLIHEAKNMVLHMHTEGYLPQREELIKVVGNEGKAVMQLTASAMHRGSYISDHDLLIAGKLAHVLAGGDLPSGSLVTGQYLLDLEREAFLSLCGEPKTQARMGHMLKTGKPLRN